MLKIENLHASVDGKDILRGLSLTIQPGEVHAIMGPNGSGKSTLSAVIAGKEEYEVEGGSIDFEGENLFDLDPEERAHKGIFLSFQYPIEIPGISVANFIKTAINAKRKMQGLEKALHDLSLRLPTPEVRSFAFTLIQNLQYGTSISNVLSDLSEDMRKMQVMSVEEKIGKLSAKMSVPLILFIMFPIVVLIIAPGVMQLL